MKTFKLAAIVSLVLSTSAMAEDFSTYTKEILTDKEVAVMKKAIGKRMKDPDSVRLTEDEIVALYGGTDQLLVGCTEFNAKNSYGGYGQPEIAMFFMKKGGRGHTSIVLVSHSTAAEMEVCMAQEQAFGR